MLFVDPLIYAAVWVEGTHHQVDHYLIFALIQQESGFRPHVVGDNGDSYGLMQLNLKGAGAGHGREELLDVSNNIRLGVAYLAECIAAFPNDTLSGLAAYRQGVQGVEVNGRDVSLRYTHNIMALAERYRKEGVQRYPYNHPHAYKHMRF